MSTTNPEPLAERLISLDAYRGFVMLAMASGGLGLARLTSDFGQGPLLETLAFHAEHVDWRGGSFWDMIQPSFMFIVGVALPFSNARRKEQGQPWGQRFRHALVRSLILVALAIFLSSNWSERTNFTFTNVLAQIGLGYTFVLLLLESPPGVILAVSLAILVGDWALFASYPLPDPEFNYLSVGVDANWRFLEGFTRHWEKNSNVGWAFDRWFLNLFPRADGKPFLYNEGGYSTLNFIPSISTMLFGVLAGQWLRAPSFSRKAKVVGLVLAGALFLVTAATLDESICPIVKRLWTPSWVLHSTAWTCWMLAGFYLVIDVWGLRRWAFPLVVVGLNSIAMYVMAQLMKPWVRKTIQIHVGTLFAWLHDRLGLALDPKVFVGPYATVYESAAVLFGLWLICYWMYRQRVFLRI